MNQMYKLLRKVYTVLFSLILFFIVVSTRACQHLRLGNIYSDPKKEKEIDGWVKRIIFCTVGVDCSANRMPSSRVSHEALEGQVVSFFIDTKRSPDMATLWNEYMEAIINAKKRLTEIGNLEREIISNPNKALDLSSEVESLIKRYREYDLQSDLIFLMIKLQLIIDGNPPFSEDQRPQRDMVQIFFHKTENRAVLDKCRRIARGRSTKAGVLLSCI